MPELKIFIIPDPKRNHKPAEGNADPSRILPHKGYLYTNDLQFIDNVGAWFSALNGIEVQFNQWVMEFIDVREKEGENTGTPPNAKSFYTSAYTLDSLTSLSHLTERIEELKAEMK